MKNISLGVAVLVFMSISVFEPLFVSAQTSCGNIVGEENGESYAVPIEDCANPFGFVNLNPNLNVSYASTEIEDGGVYEFVGSENTFTLTGTHPLAFDTGYSIYFHEGDDRRFVRDGGMAVPFTFTATGTYSLVLYEYGELILTQNVFEGLLATIIPTAHAFPGISRVITFDVVAPVPEPTGASSVLFLPGIMGSRLYEESDVCDSEIAEQERWLSRDECDQGRLGMNLVGASAYNLYTKTDALVDETYGLNLYKSFIEALEDWKDNEKLIKDYALVPYDWRLGLDGILRTRLNEDGKIVYDAAATYEDSYLYETFRALIEDSKSGKVTIVTHSNGGLLAKMFLKTLELNNDPLADKVDTIIMVAAPQVGTPDALVGMLHGTEINFVMSQETTRRLLNTMPFAYHLLPNNGYFSGTGASVETPVITFEQGTETAEWIDTFGEKIQDAESMKMFMRKESGRTAPADDDLLNPAVVDGILFNYADVIETLLANWEPGPSTKLYEIAGVGVDTPVGISYFTDRECVSRNPLKLFTCTEYASKLGYRVNMTVDGDGTVVVPSALSIPESDEIKRAWIDLESYNSDGILGTTNRNRQHKDIIEVDDIADFVWNTLNATTSKQYTYLSSSAPTLSGNNRLTFTLHSPLDMSVVTDEGEELSSTTESIPGGVYRRYGELQYISLPDTGTNMTLRLKGTKYGSFTLETGIQSDGETVIQSVFSGIPSDVGTEVMLPFNNGDTLDDSMLKVDYDGDGEKDVTYDTEGIVEDEVTYDDLYAAIEALKLKKSLKLVLTLTTKKAEVFHQKSVSNPKFRQHEIVTLTLLQQQINLYTKLRLISEEEKIELQRVIGSLKEG